MTKIPDMLTVIHGKLLDHVDDVGPEIFIRDATNSLGDLSKAEEWYRQEDIRSWIALYFVNQVVNANVQTEVPGVFRLAYATCDTDFLDIFETSVLPAFVNLPIVGVDIPPPRGSKYEQSY